MLVSFYRTIKFAFQSFWRNIWLSIVTIIILVLTLFSISIVGTINMVANAAIESVKEKVDVSAYFKNGVSETDILNTQANLESLSMVESIRYISSAEALAVFKEEHRDDPVVMESLEELAENPLPATLVIKANNIDDYRAILEVLESPEYSALIEDKDFEDHEEVITSLSNISKRVQRIGIIVSVIFIIIAILIIFNTIRINIYTHREEIGIMKLVGASNRFVRSPFLVESLMYAIIAVLISIAILYPLLGVITPQINDFFEGYDVNLIDYFNSHLWQIIGLQLAFSVVLSVLSSSIAIGKYLRV